jgi:hypothetical protein
MRTPIKQLADVRTGYQVREGLKTLAEGTHFLVQAKDIDAENGHVLRTDCLERITPTRDPEPYTLRKGDVLFMSRGRRRSATLVDRLPPTAGTLAPYYFFILRLKTEDVDPSFLAWAINEPTAQRYLETMARGTTIPFVAKQSFLELEINLPRLEVQRNIGDLHRLGCLEGSLLRELQSERRRFIESACQLLYQENT